ncbi:transcriptional regulator GutM [Pectinatus haikarae]|uniref:transcriptional regulator GutM n=1 Tax=Pectinatus haikarae TaxID=349096 RepID=UPI0018C53004|nr:transcriptional regulator GutM [Pectinatus haikarae]
MDITILMVCLLVFMIIQAAGTYIQVRLYKKSVRRLHKKGNIGIGGRKARFSGNIVIIVCDSSGKVVDGEILAGITIFNRFKKIPELMNRNVFELRAEYEVLAQKERKKMLGHIQAVNALCERLNNKKE